MAIKPYSMCPCGSGKQFKWCCQPYFAEIEKATQLLEKSQFQAAERAIEQLLSKFPRVPQVLGYKAELLAQQGKQDEARQVLQEVFRIEPNYPRGHWLLGNLALENEDDETGIKHFRIATESVHPNASEFLSVLLSRLAQLEMDQVHPVASKVALERASQVAPQTTEFRKAVQESFGEHSGLPLAARKTYQFRPPRGDKSVRWQMAEEALAQGKLTRAHKAFSDIAIAHPDEADAQFNLGLIRAMLGDNVRGIDSLLRSVELDTDDDRIAEAVGLVEVLRCGQGLADESDYSERVAILQIRELEAFGKAMERLQSSRRLFLQRQDQEESRILSGVLLEAQPDLGTAVQAQYAPLLANVVVSAESLALLHPRQQNVQRAVDEVLELAGSAVGEPRFASDSGRIGLSPAELTILPIRGTPDERELKIAFQNRAREFFETDWLNRPLRSLSGVTPLDAVGHSSLRKRLPGLIAFLESCLNSIGRFGFDSGRELYNFDRLRRKLGLPTLAPEDPAELEIDALSPAELAALHPESLSDEQVGQAFRAALRLDSPDLAGNFARSAATRSTIADRFAFFNLLATLAREADSPAEELKWLHEGQEADSFTNDGNRFGDFALARGRSLARQGQVEEAAKVFRQAIERQPEDLKIYSPAAETMLGRKHGPFAREFAEAGLKLAREKNQRDAEQQFLELLEAARKLD